MIVVVATTEDEVAAALERAVELGAGEAEVSAPGGQRLLVLATFADERAGERAAATLRAEGFAAVGRPESGTRLDAWMRHTAPVTFDGRLSVCFAWSEHDRSGLPGLIELGPGGFGNGTHPTTRLLIEQLLVRLEGGERVLDVGCGSGVLGLCALQLGAARVVAVDVKPAAIEAARNNAARNAMDDRLDARLAPLDDREGPFDVVLANIGRAALTDLAPQLIRLAAENGWLALSGFSPSQSSLVAGLMDPLIEIERRTAEEWAAVVVARPPVARDAPLTATGAGRV